MLRDQKLLQMEVRPQFVKIVGVVHLFTEFDTVHKKMKRIGETCHVNMGEQSNCTAGRRRLTNLRAGLKICHTILMKLVGWTR